MTLKAISEEQIIEKIRFDNPWWITNQIDSYYGNMKRRLYFDLFKPIVQEKVIKRAVVLMGPRRVGKTVMLFHTIQSLIEAGINPRKICYLSVETPIYNGISLEQLFNYCRTALGDENYQDFYIFFDEIQYLKDWEIHLKVLVDTYHSTKFIVSGSAAAALKLKSTESGAGRFTDFSLPPLTFHEFIDLKNLGDIIRPSEKEYNGLRRPFYQTIDIQLFNEHFEEYINFGGYPEVTLSKDIQADPGRYIRNDIIDKVLLRDLPSLYGIQDVQELNSLFTTIAYNSGNEFTFDELSVSSGVSKNTIKRYISYLEAAFLIQLINRVDINSKKFNRANFFKIYLTNPSLRSALFAPISRDDDFFGNMVETAIYSQFQHRTQDNLHYARWQNGEVDIVGLSRVKQKPLWAVEVKWSNRYAQRPAELKNLISYAQKNGLKQVTVTSKNIRAVHHLDGIELHFEPASLYCYTLGRNSVEGKLENIFI